MKKIKTTIFKNGYKFRLKNKRFSIVKLPDGSYGLQFDILTNKSGATCNYEHRKGKIMTTTIRLTKEAMECIAVVVLEENGNKIIS